uniref:CS domain-containing protein n=1 Tax=Palpitomonas bilix TaxID=652834 RepID=A0A7S3D8W8_9EUKA|mmetsp:Transcript_2529/g.5301  ORF Transcript_2529/g.5301 Transcript_2529/m.5301 type:complete len:245 (+) Transcript_2529:138-872(+)
MMEEYPHDAALFALASRHEKPEEFLETVFSFLQRRSPLFDGGVQAVEDAVLNIVKKYGKKAAATRFQEIEDEKDRKKREEARKEAEMRRREKEWDEEKKRQREELQKRKQKAEEKNKKQDAKSSEPPKFEEISEEGEGSEKVTKLESADAEENEDPNLQTPNAGNGGYTDNYVWTQTLQDLEVRFRIPLNIKTKDIVSSITPTKLSLGIKGETALIDGTLDDRIDPDESFWQRGKTATSGVYRN